ncbi:hypothetical protein MNV49_004165 [Pseudohyphozyma bogoriensis]|nr:hypothetical protein MNV49_004165 [Pseudohyphozyma bogoriensis]
MSRFHQPYYGVHGLYFVHSHSTIALPLVNVDATATMSELSARVSLVQTYHHAETSYGTIEARYTFPLPARAAVGGEGAFRMVKEDGTVVVGVVKEKQEAKETYDKAVKDGKLAAIMDQATPDVFQVSVGNILPGEKVKIEISFVVELDEDEENDSVRFKLPTYISTRYGAPPSSSTTPKLPSVSAAASYFTLAASIESSSPIAKIGSPSHTIETTLGPDPALPNASQLPFSNYAKINLTSQSPLDKDFVLTVKSAGLDAPRCLAEIHPSQDHDSVALSLTMVPRFKLPDVPKQEFIFLVDRSGSMGGYGNTSRIEVAKKALVVMLRSLPHKDSLFNIVSFGSSHASLWKESKAYNQKTLEEATSCVDQMHADFGGTEIRNALEYVFKTRNKERPTSVFVLTDGDAWQLDEVLETVKISVASASKEAYLRVFSLGIGNSASTAMVEGIARVGNGSSSFVNDSESFTGKTSRLLKAARSPLVRNIRVGWGVDGAVGVAASTAEKEKQSEESKMEDGFELLSNSETDATLPQGEAASKKVSLFDTSADANEPLSAGDGIPPPPTPITLAPPSPIQQSPFIIRALSPATRLYVYAILSTPAWTKGSALPSSVFLRGNLDSGDEVELEVPVTVTKLNEDASRPAPIHTLAARKIIQDLEDGQHSFKDLDADTLERTVKASIIRLGVTYGLTSKHTSVVAVDESEVAGARKAVQLVQPAVVVAPIMAQHTGCRSSVPLSAPAPRMSAPAKAKSAGGFFGGMGVRMRSAVQSAQPAALFGSAPAQAAPDLTNTMQGIAIPPPSPGSSSFYASPLPEAGSVRLEGGGGSEDEDEAEAEAMSLELEKGKSVAPPQVVKKRKGAAPAPPSAPSPASRAAAFGLREARDAKKLIHPLSDADKLDALVRQQAFDGSFDVAVLKICGITKSVADLANALPAELQKLEKNLLEQLVATICAMAFLKKKMGGEKEAWMPIWEKASDFVEEVLGEHHVTAKVEELEASVGGQAL